MTLLALGLLIFCGVHLLTSSARDWRTGMVEKLGETGFKSAYSLAVLAGLALIIIGWRGGEGVYLYTPPFGLRMLTVLMMVASVLLFIASRAPTNLRRFIRHPQLTSVLLWSAAHLLANGDSLGLLLFGSLGLWAAVTIFTINAREGEWVKPAPFPISRDVVTVVIAIIVFVGLLKGHEYFTGISLTG